ncbi:glycosyltransferase [Staphylothermus hellenicus]|uniref:Glycosyl transferase group 1 n=1 Tax=Staphylothermus hellenicus (strain DSM 12710 / JCM 10830 / BK20S6-10-b1 / P8) TaxID=591019 RepID=D7DCE9_STAHD|nr:glycosyltransferase [Staphylothermus hellenicus]ADI31846.1 glycosyl transferase group 1 [Staphylothermus hellenicus DSM 12710]
MIIHELPHRNIKDYISIYSEEDINRIIEKAEKLGDITLTHVNSTSLGGGVAEILYNLVPLMNSIGITTKWEVIKGDNEFFNVTKKIHNALQGAEIELSDEEKKIYLEKNKWNVENELALDSTHIIVHDPQPLPIRRFVESNKRWIWRCHIDLSTPYKPVWLFISQLLKGYEASIFHLKEYIHPETPTPIKYVMPPSIDPLSDKNKELAWSTIEKILNRYGVDPEKPILLQVARFDPWKDPFAAIDVYRLVKKEFPSTQLLLVTSMATDDPEGWIYYEKTLRYAGMDEDIFILTNLKGVGALEVNAFQRAATVVLQMSKREGFGLAVTEALWKRKPVVARPRGGIKLQVIDGVTGYLVETVEEAAKKTIYLIKNPQKRKELGDNGYRHVLKNFTIVRHIENYLDLLAKMV